MCYVSASYQFNYEEKGKVLLAARYRYLYSFVYTCSFVGGCWSGFIQYILTSHFVGKHPT